MVFRFLLFPFFFCLKIFVRFVPFELRCVYAGGVLIHKINLVQRGNDKNKEQKEIRSSELQSAKSIYCAGVRDESIETDSGVFAVRTQRQRTGSRLPIRQFAVVFLSDGAVSKISFFFFSFSPSPRLWYLRVETQWKSTK